MFGSGWPRDEKLYCDVVCHFAVVCYFWMVLEKSRTLFLLDSGCHVFSSKQYKESKSC